MRESLDLLDGPVPTVVASIDPDQIEALLDGRAGDRGVTPVGHRVRIRLLRITEAGVVDERGPIACQWEGVCICGWRCLSWSWGDAWRGVLPVSLEHLDDMARRGGRDGV